MDIQHYGVLLRIFRKARRKRLSDVANLIGVDLSYLSRIERGERAPPSRELNEAIASALELTTDEIRQLNDAKQCIDLGAVIAPGPLHGQVMVMIMNIKDAKRLLGKGTTILGKEEA